MSYVHETVRWLTNAGWVGWHYQERLPGGVWGFDNLGKNGRFRVQQVGSNSWFFAAPDGETFDTMRDLFAQFRLRMCDCERQSDQLEHMRNVLRLMSMEVHRIDINDFINKGFGGNRAFGEHYIHWLEQERFTACIGKSIADVDLAQEGHSVLRMLDMTAPGSNIDTSPRAAMVRFDEKFPGRREARR